MSCVLTSNKTGPGGYGRCGAKRFGKKIWFTHVLAWVDANGRLPSPGLRILHSCDTPACVNPAHLSEGTQAENVAQMIERGRADFQVGTHKEQRKTHCIHDHPFDEENTRITPAGARACRACARAAALRAYYRKKKVS